MIKIEEQIKAVQRMQEYIKQHIDEQITTIELSQVSHYSPWYSYRIFLRYLNVSPSDYIRRLRLSKSALLLRDEEVKVIDVAYKAGYDSVDGYQRAFHREFGYNPKEYANDPVPIQLFIPYLVESKFYEKEKVNIMEKAKTVFVQVIKKPARKVIIKRGIEAKGYFTYVKEVGCDIWGLLKSIKSISDEPVSLWLPEKYIKAGTSEYVQGVEVSIDHDGIIPEGLDVIVLPESTYLMFLGEPFPEEEYCEAIEQVQDAIKKYDPSILGFVWDDQNPRIQLEPIGNRGYMELKPVK